MGITQQDREAWGLDLDHECGTAMKFLLELTGFPDLQCKLQGVFDASTHVPVLRKSAVSVVESRLCFGVSLAVLHDTPLLAVIDLAHGEIQDFLIPVAKGSSVSHAAFHLEVIDVPAGTVVFGSTKESGPGGVIEQQYGLNTSPGASDSFHVIYQINPPVMATAVSVDAIDAAGKLIRNSGRFMEHASISNFGAPLATAASLRVRYRPRLTRLLLEMKSLPGVSAPNLKPADLFDVKAPAVTFGGFNQMRRFIADGAQLKDVTGSYSYETPATFPMVLTDFSPRQVAARYLALDPGRTLKVDPAALTIKFEPPKKPSSVATSWERLKGLFWRP